MRIAIIAPGSRGDVEPYIALGKGLKKANNTVRLITHQNFQSLVSSHGLDFWPIESNVQDFAQSAEMSEGLEKGNFLSVLSQMKKEAERLAISVAETGLSACKDMDMIIAGLGGLFVGFSLAEKFDIPFVQAYYIPFTPTRVFPSFLFPKLPQGFNGALNRSSYHIMRQIIWQSFRSTDNLTRKKVLNLPGTSFWGPYKSSRLHKYPILYGFSPSVIPPPTDWGSNTHVTGYWYLDPPDDWTPSQELIDFVDAGSPPIYIGFGSMSNRNPQEAADLVVKALELSKQRGIILSGWGGLQKTDLPKSVFMVDSVPFSWLFPRVGTVVHHGGAGTTAFGLRAGIPSIIVPFFADQPFWGHLVAKLGVGPEPIPRKKLTAERLAKAIEKALTNQTMRQRAVGLGSKIQAEDGVSRAVAVVQEIQESAIV
jgi:UDP:flavonoid glycosyltransferase YjiC (YdhE family)